MSPFVIVIFGATGDLAQHKLLPALFSLYKKNQLGPKFYIAGFARRELSNEGYRQMLREELQLSKDEMWDEFAENIYYQQGLFDESTGYEELHGRIARLEKEKGLCISRLFYLATPPDNYLAILTNLKQTKLSQGCRHKAAGWTRLAIEKPFGKDLDTARHLDRHLSDIFKEEQIYRVDHYLGKETVQNMIAFRFANSVFEPVWNRQHIDHVQITFAEKKGIGKRGKFFEGVGMLRDVAQNHLLQLMATVAMEQPRSFSKESVRDARVNAIKAIKPLTPSEVSKYVVRGQYEGYRQEKDVSPHSQTDTFSAMKLFVNTDRFAGVPFYLRAGKEMEKDIVDIKIVFIQTCHLLFKEYGCPEVGNVLTIRIQPDEGIGMQVIAKKPGTGLALDTVDMHFSYHQRFGGHGADAYERLLVDILHGDQMLFNRSDELESSWQLISSILRGWEGDKRDPTHYEKGSMGPKEAFDLIEKDGRKWL